MYDLEGKRVWVAGHRGLVGSRVVRRLERERIAELITADSHDLDLRRQVDTEDFVARVKPDVVILAAARVGGIHANRTRQAEFLYDNVMISANVIEAARLGGVEKTVLLGSSCSYPRNAAQPMTEEALLTGPLEPTNEGYAVAKIAALELGKFYRDQFGMRVISLMPTNLYGAGDNFDLESSHVLPALLRKIHEAKMTGARSVTVWGTGRPRREFLYADDLADAVVHVLRVYESGLHLNVGTGKDVSIRELVDLIADVVGWSGEVVYDESMPDGAARKLLDVTRLHALGWRASTNLRSGIEATYRWFVQHYVPSVRG